LPALTEHFELSMKTNCPPRVLVIDDHAGFRTSLARALTTSGYTVRTGADGREGIEIAREFQPSVVVCDMHMPNGNGESVLGAMRQEEGLESSQFILMTADRDGTPQRFSMDLGADDYLAKPFTTEDLLKCVNARFQRSQLYQKAEERVLHWLHDTISHSLPHELFTPLTGIVGYAEVLREEIGRVTPAEARTMVAGIQQSAERLHRTLKNYLHILDVLDQKIPLESVEKTVSVSGLLRIIYAAASAVTNTHGRAEDLTIECVETELPVTIDSLSTIVTELVDNACKYSARGTPLLLRVQRNADGVATLSISDRGRGMTPDQIAQIGAFRQFDRKKYEQQGLGLGLTLTQHLVERHGGSFRIECSQGKGTTMLASWQIKNS
jgi:signal transduction histidine kinase